MLVVEDQAALELLVYEMLARRGWETAAAAGRRGTARRGILPPPPRESISTSRYFPAVQPGWKAIPRCSIEEDPTCLSPPSSTPTDEAPALATASFLPIVKAFAGQAGSRSTPATSRSPAASSPRSRRASPQPTGRRRARRARRARDAPRGEHHQGAEHLGIHPAAEGRDRRAPGAGLRHPRLPRRRVDRRGEGHPRALRPHQGLRGQPRAVSERVSDRQAKADFDKAMLGFQIEKGVIEKASVANKTKYAKLEYMQSIVDPVLRKHQLFVRWSTEALLSGKTRVTCICTHIGGHSETSSMDVNPDKSGSKNEIQAEGSLLTCTALP